MNIIHFSEDQGRSGSIGPKLEGLGIGQMLELVYPTLAVSFGEGANYWALDWLPACQFGPWRASRLLQITCQATSASEL